MKNLKKKARPSFITSKGSRKGIYTVNKTNSRTVGLFLYPKNHSLAIVEAAVI